MMFQHSFCHIHQKLSWCHTMRAHFSTTLESGCQYNRVFPMLHNVGNIGIFVLLKSGNKLDTVISHINVRSKQNDKYKSAQTITELEKRIRLNHTCAVRPL